MSIKAELQCPISLDWLEDPICAPCCSRAFSRTSLISHMSIENTICPWCRGDLTLSGFNPETAPKNLIIANILDIVKNTELGLQLQSPQPQPQPPQEQWSGKYIMLHNEIGSDKPDKPVIAQIQLSLNDKALRESASASSKTLLILVVDKSGSMSGNPISQVKYALTRIKQLSQSSPSIKLVIIAYDEVFHEITDPSCLSAGGGTSFNEAFKGIYRVCRSNQEIQNAVVIFLTDGEDSRVPRDKRQELTNTLRTELKKCWVGKSIIVHSIGFASAHDFTFLDSIRKVGTEEGAYRYADPSEDTDILSTKINSIADSIITYSRIPVEIITRSDVNSMDLIKTQLIDGKVTIWKNHTSSSSSSSSSRETIVDIKCNNQLFSVKLETNNSCSRDLWVEWYSKLVDDIIEETIKFNTMATASVTDARDIELFGTLLTVRAQAILKRLEKIPVDESELEHNPIPIIARLNSTLHTISEIMSGKNIDTLKLTDLKYESQFKQQKPAHQAQKSLPDAPRTNTSTIIQPLFSATKLPPVYNYRATRLQPINDLHKAIINAKLDTVAELATKQMIPDQIENSPIAIASCIGRLNVLEKLLSIQSVKTQTQNKFGETALDLAALYGYWKAYDILINAGYTHKLNKQLILNTCISKGYTNTAERLLRHTGPVLSKEMMSFPGLNTRTVTWLMANMETDFNNKINTSIKKGVINIIISNLSNISKLSFADYADILVAPTTEQIIIIDILLQNNKLDPMEEWFAFRRSYAYSYIQGSELDESEEIQWPLFIAAEKGQQALVNTLLKYPSVLASINKQNNIGTTALWIAACNNNADIVLTLLSNGADPNTCNFKGDSALIPACQKGHISIIKLLLEAGINIELHNQARDNAVLICCRNGQADALELLLKKYQENDLLSKVLNTCADIDGFNPLLAAAELNRDKCIEVLHRFGANLEFRTADTNEILKGATACHVAAFYGRTNALKMLYKLGANLEVQTSDSGMTPLHISVQRGHGYEGNVANVRFLFNIGINTEITDKFGRKARYYASNKGNETVFKEFFYNPLIVPLIKLIRSVRNKSNAINIIKKHGQSLGVFDYNNLLNIDCGQGVTPIELAALSNEQDLYDLFIGLGADPNIKNYHGINAKFWRNLHSTSGMLDTEVRKVQSMIDHSLQNKLLITLTNDTRPPEYSTDFDTRNGNIITKMNTGFDQKIRKITLDQLELAKYGEHSLITFLDKSNKLIISCSKNELAQLLWDAKIHTIMSIAVAPDDSKLQATHHLALYIYTADDTICKQVNDSLQQWQTTNTNQWTPYINCLYQALTLIPPFQGECYRKVIGNKFKNLPIGTIIEWNSFSNTTSDWANVVETQDGMHGMHGMSSAVIYIIKSKTGRSLNTYSKYPQNNEIVFLPGSKFIIKDYYLNNVIVFGQANIRKVTYGARDVDLAKAVEGKTTIIVDIEEIITI